MSRQNSVRKLDGNFALGCGAGTDFPLNIYFNAW